MNKKFNSVRKVVSKYFVKAAMEDSFADFQKKKRLKTGPKVDPKTKKNNLKKSLKHSKGQKDIRSLIKKNELVSYSRDFDQVCKQSGVDVDAEQLQLAITLSKSLNDFQSSSKDIEIENKQLSLQERSAKIRTTLQEYGFKVNNSKILSSISINKRKKYTKNPKLLQISSVERQQEISNKYSQVLANNICKSPNENKECSYMKNTIFYKATNIPYNLVINDETFYVSNLIDKPTHKTCFLRDWCEIPGRPASPKVMHNDINFETMEYSQVELDNVLSGSVHMAQNILTSKQSINKSIIADSKDYNCTKNPTPSCSYNSTNNESQISELLDPNELQVQVSDIQDSEKCSSTKENIEYVDLIKDNSLKDNSRKSSQVIDLQDLNSRQFRSASPDLFDDEVSFIMKDKNNCSSMDTNEVCSIIENKNNCSIINTNEICSIIENKNNCSIINTNEICSIIEDKNNCKIIDTNEICSIIEDKNNCKIIDRNEICSIIEDKNLNDIKDTNKVCSIIEDKNLNGTRDIISKHDNCSTMFMDLTECATNIYSNLNVTKNITKRKSNDLMDITECIDVNSNNSIIEVVSSSGKNNDNKVKNVELVDLTQVYCSPKMDKGGAKNSASLELDDTIIYDNNEFTNVNVSIDLQEPIVLGNEESTKDVMNNGKPSESDNMRNNETMEEHFANSENNIENVDFEYNNHEDINIDLTQGSAPSEDLRNYPEFMYDYFKCETLEHNSGVLTNNEKDNDIISLKSVSFVNDNENENIDIDLTQESEKSFDMTEENYEINCPGTSCKNDSVLEIFDNNVGTIDNQNNSILSVENIVDDSDFVEENNEDDKIDLTQATEEISERNIATGCFYVHKNNSKLGKINNISIDYDEMFDEITSEYRNVSKNISENNSSEKDDVNRSNPSINSEVFEISDKELNYSIHHSIHENINIDFENRVSLNRSLSDSYVPTVNVPLSPIKEKNNSEQNTPIKRNRDIGDVIIQTPKNNEYIIKTREVTPMADYESMTSPERNEELEKYGIKPFKRKRAIQLLTYVYNQTHPVIESGSPDEGPSKRLKRDNKKSSPKNNSKSPKKCLDFGSAVNKENDIFIVTKETPDLKTIECDPMEWVFQNREKAKVPSCRVPLHIAFHNYVSCRRLLKEAILRYEPVNIDIIHKDLVNSGHKYNPKDLLKFMDRKCITVKTAENNLRNKK